MGVTACRRSTVFFELYGRAPEPKTAKLTKQDAAGPALSCSTTAEDKDWAASRAVLERFRTQLYVNPNNVPADLPRDALTALAAVATSSPVRRSAAAQGMWRDAIELRAHTPAVDLAAVADTATVLLCAEKAALGYEMCAELLLHNTSFRHRVETAVSTAEVEDALRLLSVFVMCGGADHHHNHHRRPVPAALLPLFEATLHHSRSAVARADKSQRSGLAHVVEVLAWALDWCDDGTAAVALQRLRPLLPQWLLFLFAPFDAAAAAQSTSAFALLSPRWLCEMVHHAADAGDHQRVEQLLRHAQRKEAAIPAYRIFQLSTRVADVLVSRFPHLPASAQAVATYGTALNRDALLHFGTTKDGLERTVDVLATMAGAEPYFALRSLMRRQPAERAAAVQEATGDVLTGNLQLNWNTALGFTMHEVAAMNPHWRAYLPETLRLLSDAGKSRLFWSLAAEYNAADGVANLSVAASLSQTMSRSGRWWHAMEVMDLVAAAPLPRNLTEESYLTAACTDTLRALLHGRRWQEALEVLSMVGTLVPAREATVVSQLLTSLPAAAPWQSALQLAESKGFAVDIAAALLRVLQDRSASPLQLSRSQQRVAVPVFAQHGRWDLMRTLVAHNPGDVHAWRGLLQSLERCVDAVDDAVGAFVLSSVPATLSHDPRTFSAVAQTCLQHGWYTVLASHLQASSSSSSTAALPTISCLCQEYAYLLDYLQRGTRPPLTYAFADPYAIHQLAACVAARHLSVLAQLPSKAAVSKKQASAYLRVPYENLGTMRHREERSGTTSTIKVYSAAAGPFLHEHVLHVSAEGLLFGYKVPGASLFASARGMLQALQLSGVYQLTYNMSAASSGVFVLHPATVPPRHYAFTLHVQLCLSGLADAPFVPLLATSFFKRYAMVWHAGTHARHEVTAVVCTENGLDAKTALRALKRDLNAEGWGFVETEPGAGDLYHILCVRYAPLTAERQIGDVQVVTCGPRDLQPINAGADTVSWPDAA